ncbi:MAG: RIP metalloprotease RseP [Alphaproteobacteria bacterium]|nr:RIP metalloprotease RseP [Alphaproteobacteria bacterium]
MALVFSLLTFIILLGVVVVVHELGHLVIARLNGVFCEVFSFGFGTTLFSRKDSKGTEWRISLYPLGGYVRMFGDSDASSVKEVIPAGYTEEDMERMSAHRKKPWQRLLIAAGGPFANFIFSILVLFTLSTINGMPEYDNTITVTSESSLAYMSGLRTGDAITKANDTPVKDFEELVTQVKKSVGKKLALELKRGETTQTIDINMFKEIDGKTEAIPVLGISPNGFSYKAVSVWESARSAVASTYFIASENIKAMFKIATNKMSTKNVGGIVSIFKVSSASAEAGFVNFIMMVAMISTVLGAINLLPIPVLDGGGILISAIEWIIGRPLNKRFVSAIFSVGLFAVVALMLLGLWNDLSGFKFFGSIKDSLESWLGHFFK